MGDEGRMSTTGLTIIGLLATLAIGGFVLDTLLWLLGWKGRERPPRWKVDVRPADHPSTDLKD